MIIKRNEIRSLKRPHEQNGNGYEIIEFLAEGENLPQGVNLFAKCRLETGCSIGKHVHNGETEIYYCL